MVEDKLRVLVVDDEAAIRRFLYASLTAHGYHVYQADSGQGALQGVIEHRPDVVILDLGLPDLDGIEVVRLLRQWTQIPIVILSVREHEQDKVSALDAGADDYVTKPFAMGELLARLRTAVRHAAGAPAEPVFVSDGLKVDLGRRTVIVDGREVQLTPTEYDLLRVLVNHAGKVLTHRHLLREVWGLAYEDEKHLLRVNISNLRRKIEADANRPHYILSEPGVGYRLRPHP